MRGWSRALVVPLVAATLWLIPSDQLDTEVAGAAEVATLADAAPTTASSSAAAPELLTDGSETTAMVEATVAPPSTLAVVTSTTPTVDPVTAANQATSPAEIITTTTVSATSSTAEPTTTVTSLSLGEQALQRVAFDWQTAFPDWRVEFVGPRNGIRALTYPGEKRIEIFVRTSDTAATLHRVFAHELGHVIDVEWNSDDDRNRWLDQRGLSGSTRWWPNAEAPDFATGAGDFAEAFAVLETGVTTRSTLAGQPTRADLDLLRELSQR